MTLGVYIITYRRPVALDRLLNALKSQIVSRNDTVSVCVVDNDCTGANGDVVNRYSEHYPFFLHVIKAPERGIVYARNRAVDHFLQHGAEALVFIDDDEVPVERSWLQALIETQQTHESDIVYSDVRVRADSEEKRWVVNAFRVPAAQAAVVPTTKFYTNNLLVMRRVFERLYPPFDLRFAMTGSSDYHFCIRCNHAGFKAIYTPFAPVTEIFPSTKATFRWFFLRGYRSGEGATRSVMYERPGFKTVMQCAAMGLARVAFGFVQLGRALVKWDRGLLANALLRFGSGTGSFAGFFRLSYREYETIHGR